MFETQKVRRYDKFRKEWSQHQNKCKSQMGQDQVSGGVRVLCWLAATVAIFYGNLQNSIIRSKSLLKSNSVISLQIGVMSDQIFGQVHFCYIFYTKPNIFKISLKCHFYLNFIEMNTQHLRIVQSLFVYSTIISCLRNCQNFIY